MTTILLSTLFEGNIFFESLNIILKTGFLWKHKCLNPFFGAEDTLRINSLLKLHFWTRNFFVPSIHRFGTFFSWLTKHKNKVIHSHWDLTQIKSRVLVHYPYDRKIRAKKPSISSSLMFMELQKTIIHAIKSSG